MENRKYTVGQNVFIISNNAYIMEMKVLRVTGDFYTLRSVENPSNGIRLKKHRLFPTREEAEKTMNSERQKRDNKSGRPKHWYD